MLFTIYSSVMAQFAVGLVLQIFLWRFLGRNGRPVPRQMALLFLVFAIFPVLHFLIHRSLDHLVAALALGGAYIMSFPAASAQSPTLLITDELSRQPQGLSETELMVRMSQRVNLVGDRVDDLKADGLCTGDGEQAQPSRFGIILGYIFWVYRRCLGLPMGG
ncbi:MAG: hypothetical protein KGQ59_07630, partial [Bdellovibrionales bacterium]|nr:hypothetical protein [Bdellovibrionales bacterium]